MGSAEIHNWVKSLAAKGESLRLRSKFLFSIVVIIAGLTTATLLIVRQTVQAQAQKQMEQDARNALLMFQVVEQQRLALMNRKADLLATLAFLRNGDKTTIEEAIQDPWQSEDCDLFALSDRKWNIVALKTRAPEPAKADADLALRRLLREKNGQGWWFSGKHIYQIVVKPYYEDPPTNRVLLGAVVLGREMDAARVKDLSRMSSSEVAFRYGNEIVLSSLSPMQERELAQALNNQAPGKEITQLTMAKRDYLARSTELTPDLRPELSLTVLKSDEETLAALASLNHLFLVIGFLAVLAGAALAYVISGSITGPLGSLVRGVQALELGNFSYPLKASGGDEVARVTRAFENMRGTLEKNEAQRQQLEDQLRQSQKMDALGRLAGGVAHDFNNLLTIIKGHGDVMLMRLSPADQLHASGQQIVKAADRAAGLTRQLLAFCRMQMLQPKVMDLNALVSEMCKLLRRLVREDIAFTFHAGESLGRVKADPGQIEQVIINLTVNACDAMPEGGKLTIETQNAIVDEALAASRTSLQPGEYVLLTVTDTGQGMDPVTKSRIFEPFFTTKEQGKGTGLGLATVYGVVKQSGGYIWVDSEPGKGARFEVYLPRVRERAEVITSPVFSDGQNQRRGTVLIAEDEDEVRELASQFLTAAGYSVLSAKDGMEAMEVAKRSNKPVDVLITDVVMPKMKGPELARRLKDSAKNMKIVYVSGYLEYNKGKDEFLAEGFFLQKPFSRGALVQKVDEALGRKVPVLVEA